MLSTADISQRRISAGSAIICPTHKPLLNYGNLTVFQNGGHLPSWSFKNRF